MAERKSRKSAVEEEQFFELEYLGRKGLCCRYGEVNVSTDVSGVEDITLNVGGEIGAKTLPVRIGELPESSALRGKDVPTWRKTVKSVLWNWKTASHSGKNLLLPERSVWRKGCFPVPWTCVCVPPAV